MGEQRQEHRSTEDRLRDRASNLKGQLLGVGPLRKVFFRTIEEWLVTVGVSEEGALTSESAVGALAFRHAPAAGVGL